MFERVSTFEINLTRIHGGLVVRWMTLFFLFFILKIQNWFQFTTVIPLLRHSINSIIRYTRLFYILFENDTLMEGCHRR